MKKNHHNHHRVDKNKHYWIKYIFLFGAILLVAIISLIATLVGGRKMHANKIVSLNKGNENNLLNNTITTLVKSPVDVHVEMPVETPHRASLQCNCKKLLRQEKKEKKFLQSLNFFQPPSDWESLLGYLYADSNKIKQTLIKQKISPNRDKSAVDNYFTIIDNNKNKIPIKVLINQFDEQAEFVSNDILPAELLPVVSKDVEHTEEYGYLVCNQQNAVLLLDFFAKMRKEIHEEIKATSIDKYEFAEKKRFEEKIVAMGEEAVKEAQGKMAKISIFNSIINERNKMRNDFGDFMGKEKFNRVTL